MFERAESLDLESMNSTPSAETRLTALVTGGSRGVGAATCLALANRGFDVVLTYRNKASRASAVASEVGAVGKQALPVQTDITQPDELNRLHGAVEQWAGGLDALVLNASGGLERDLLEKDPNYPMRINHDAQIAVLEAMTPLFRPKCTVVFVTSHWAHLYPAAVQMPEYEPVARSKHAGERALRNRIGDLAGRGARLVVVTGDMVEGTITAKLLERASPGLTSARRELIQELPSTADMAQAIAMAVTDVSVESGATVVVGGDLDSIPRAPTALESGTTE
jgi:NAD(P)-dependent dehydrogenase (short-subunit alcohol dehydrogenase family)